MSSSPNVQVSSCEFVERHSRAVASLRPANDEWKRSSRFIDNCREHSIARSGTMRQGEQSLASVRDGGDAPTSKHLARCQGPTVHSIWGLKRRWRLKLP